jgi:hypothetical protein
VEAVSRQYQQQLQTLRDEGDQLSTNENDNRLLGNEEKVRLRYRTAKNQRKVLRETPFCYLWKPGPDCSSADEVISSHCTCFGCLFSTPTNPLPCGHVLCDACVVDFSGSSEGHDKRPTRHTDFPEAFRPGNSWLEIYDCPLCMSSLREPWRLMKEPQEAAPRILLLDGFVLLISN